MAFNPSRIAGLWLWVDAADITTLFQDTAATQPVTANGQAVRRFGDKSRNYWSATGGNDMTYAGAAPPTYLTAGADGLPAISNARFSTANNLDATFDRSVSVYAVCDDSTTAANTFPWYCVSTPGYFGNYHNNANKLRTYNLSGLAPGAKALNYTAWANRIESLRYDGKTLFTQTAQADTRALESLGGVIATTPTTGALQLTGKLMIGYNASDIVYGAFKEMAVFNRCLSDAEHQQVMDYLAAKWQLTAKPLLLCVGDSRMATNDTGGADAPWKQLQTALGAGWQVECDAYAGRNIYLAWNEMGVSVRGRTWPRASGYRQVALVTMGANDVHQFSNPPLNPESYYNEYRDFCIRLAEMGYAVIAATCPDRGDIAVSALFAAFNAALRADHSFAAGFSDRSAVPEAQDFNNTTYWAADKVHWKQPLVALIVACDLAAIQAVTLTTATGAASQYAVDRAAVASQLATQAAQVVGTLTVLNQAQAGTDIGQAAQRIADEAEAAAALAAQLPQLVSVTVLDQAATGTAVTEATAQTRETAAGVAADAAARADVQGNMAAVLDGRTFGTGPNTVTVTVTDSETAAVIGSAAVALGTLRATTNASGVAVFYAETNTYTLSISKGGFQHEAQSVVVSGNMAVAATMTPRATPPGHDPHSSNPA
jgi:hypothetical protein